LPFDDSTHGYSIDRLIYVIHIFMILLFVGWLIFLIYSLIKFRQRPGHKVIYKENHFKAPTYIEVAVAIFELVLLVGFSFPVVHHVRAMFPPQKDALEIRVVAEQFAWNIHYPGSDGIFGKTNLKLISSTNPVGLDRDDPNAKDDIVTINQLNIPVHKPIVVKLSTKDVIHSFSIPVMRVKQDVIPGQVIPVWFEAKETGNFEIACAQLCGLGHYRMRGFFNIQTPEEFNAWLAKNAPKPKPKPAPHPAQPAPVATPPVSVSTVGTAAAPTTGH